MTTTTARIIHGDCLSVLQAMPPSSLDLVFGSPPYEDARSYGIDFSLKGQAWVDWMVLVFKASLRVSRGLVAFVVEGRTKQFRWSATPALLMADLHRAGICLRKPPIYERDGVPGSGGPDWLKNRYEFIVCATNGGKLPWSESTAMGHAPKWAPGGAPSHRMPNGRRVAGVHTKRGTKQTVRQGYNPPAIANPGNIIDCGAAGGGQLGSTIAHENEAPFPEKLAEFFVRSFCPPGGTTLDPFCGSGTTLKVATKFGRNAIGIDVRQSQVELSTRRLAEVSPDQSQANAV